MKLLTVLTFLSTIVSVAQAKVLQEGWFQVLSGQQHVGYIVHRYEFNEAKKQFRFNSFMKTNTLGGDIAESISATSSDVFAPISYQYTTQSGKSVKLIDASFKNNQMTAKITEDGQARTELAKLEKGTILSYFLVYKILMGKTGIKDGLSVQYSAIAEEDAKIYKEGFLDVKSSEPVAGQDTFKVLNTFKDIKSISVITPTGEILQIRQPTTGLQVVAATKEDATKGFPSSEKTIKTLFGKIPGNSPILAHASTGTPKEVPQKIMEPSVNETGLPKGATIPPGKPFKPADKGTNKEAEKKE